MKMVQRGVLIQIYPLGLFWDFTPKVIIDGWCGCFKITPYLVFLSHVMMFRSSKCIHKTLVVAASNFSKKDYLIWGRDSISWGQILFLCSKISNFLLFYQERNFVWHIICCLFNDFFSLYVKLNISL